MPTHEYEITIQLSIPSLANPRYRDLTPKEFERGGRVIGGDQGDLRFSGYERDETKNQTILIDPVLLTGHENLTEDEVNNIATDILWAVHSDLGEEAIW